MSRDTQSGQQLMQNRTPSGRAAGMTNWQRDLCETYARPPCRPTGNRVDSAAKDVQRDASIVGFGAADHLRSAGPSLEYRPSDVKRSKVLLSP